MGLKIKPAVAKWIKNLSDEGMPGFAGTIADVTQEIDSDETSAVDVAQSILKDPALTSRLLKMTNTIFYNPNTRKISTVSRAVMILGFEKVRALTLTLALVESLNDGQQRDILTAEIAQSFHAAFQAQQFAELSRCESPENVFIAALLSRLGNMAFWAFAGEEANELVSLISAGQMTVEQAEKTVLKFSLHELSHGLSQSWSLGQLLEDTLDAKGNADLQVAIIKMSHEFTAAVSKYGWESDELNAVIATIADTLALSVEEVLELTQTNAKRAKDIAKLYGITEASKKIPQPRGNLDDELGDEALIEESTVEAELDEAVRSQPPEPDPHLQLSILQDIADAIEEKPSINIILEMVLEGLYRGIGMDRAMFTVLSKDNRKLICKYALGADNEKILQRFQIDISPTTNIFKQIVTNKKARHIEADPKKLAGTMSKETFNLIGAPPYLVMPAIVRGKVIGLFIADRNASARSIEEKDFIAFQQFCQQANMGLTFLAMQG